MDSFTDCIMPEQPDRKSAAINKTNLHRYGHAKTVAKLIIPPPNPVTLVKIISELRLRIFYDELSTPQIFAN